MRLTADNRTKTVAGLLTAVLLWMAWPAAGFAPLLFIALVPLLWLENETVKQKQAGKKPRFFLYSYLCFLIFNLLTTWWIWFASPFGMCGAVFANALLMAAVFQLFHFIHLRSGDTVGYASLVILWIAFEFQHLNWDLSWPWLSFGNGFAAWANMVQWYEYTGTGGGTLWILLINILLFRAWTNVVSRRKYLITAASLLVLPLILSAYIHHRYTEQCTVDAEHVEVVVVQPNIDPYNEKFSGMSSDQQLDRMLELSAKKITANTDLIVWPETALPDGLWEEHFNEQEQIGRIGSFIRSFHNVPLLTGVASYKMYTGTHPASARKFRDTEDYYDAFNTAMLVQSDKPLQLYHKSKLVPGVEKMPFPAVFKYLDKFAIELGGIAGTLGMEDSAKVFSAGKITCAPVICYESIYGDYVGDYVRKGANLLCIITNDGWWSNTPGYRQHCQYARLRAIEHRRSIARSANTGISCFINEQGEILQPTGWWVPASIRSNVTLNNQLTFYSRHGDYLGYAARWFSALLLIYAAYLFLKTRRRNTAS